MARLILLPSLFLLPLLLRLLVLAPPARAAVPPWPATYALNASTIVMPCNESGLLAGAATAGWHIKSFDWANARGAWSAHRPMDADEMLLAQARLSAESDPSGHSWVYRNGCKQLAFMRVVQEVLSDGLHDAWFIQYRPGGSGGPNGGYYNDPCDRSQTPPLCSSLFHACTGCMDSCQGTCDCGGVVPCGIYLADFRAKNLAVNGVTLKDWYINALMVSNTTLLAPGGIISGMFIDDGKIEREIGGGGGVEPYKPYFAVRLALRSPTCLPDCQAGRRAARSSRTLTSSTTPV